MHECWQSGTLTVQGKTLMLTKLMLVLPAVCSSSLTGSLRSNSKKVGRLKTTAKARTAATTTPTLDMVRVQQHRREADGDDLGEDRVDVRVATLLLLTLLLWPPLTARVGALALLTLARLLLM